MDVKPGYKQTEVGAIPEEWSVCSFDEACRRLNAKAHQIQTSEYQRTGSIPVVDQGQKPIVGYTDRVDRTFNCPDDGVIVFGDHTCIVKFVDFDFAVGADGTQLIGARATDSTRFHAYGLELHGVSSTGYNRHFKFLRERLFIRPPLREQRAIATALSDVDALLDGLDRLIAKKRDIKLAAMEQLVTGQARLPGFRGEWETKVIGDISTVKKGTQLHSSETNPDGHFPHFNGGISPSSYTDKFNAPANTIAISEGGNSCGYVQLVPKPFWCGGHCYSVVPKSADNRFLFYALKGRQTAIQGLRVGSGLPNVQKSALEAFELRLPFDKAEQAAIATILCDIDAEIDALEARRDKTRALKQGMMQELLTGRTRLV